MLSITFLLWPLLATVTHSAQLYKIINQDGSVTYTDKYQPNAQVVDLSSVNSAVMPSIPTPAVTPNQRDTPEKNPDYKLTFISPEDKQTIRNNLGTVSFSATLSSTDNLSALPDGKFYLILNGKLIQSNSAPTFTVQNLDRGEHNVQIKLIHQTGKILASTQTRVFYLKQASRLINPN